MGAAPLDAASSAGRGIRAGSSACRSTDRVLAVASQRQLTVNWLRRRALLDVEAAPLPPLTRDEVARVLARRGLDSARLDEVMATCLGHPLALSLATDALRRNESPARALISGTANDELLALVVGDLDPEHARALEIAAATSRLTIDHLEDRGFSPAVAAFDWLLSQPWTRPSICGVRLPPLVRRAVLRRLRQRSPLRHMELVRSLAASFERHLPAGGARYRDFHPLLALSLTPKLGDPGAVRGRPAVSSAVATALRR